MDDNDKFISKWKSIHEKTMVQYVMPKLLVLLLLLISGNVILFWIYHFVVREKIVTIIALNAMTVTISIVGDVLRRFSGEKRYRKIINKEFSNL